MSADATRAFFRQFRWLRRLKETALPLLVVGLIVSFQYEFVSCGFVRFGVTTGVVPDTCVRVLGDRFVAEATRFSFSLTAFLLVSVAVVLTTDQRLIEDGEDDDETGTDDEESDEDEESDGGDLPPGDRFIVRWSGGESASEEGDTRYEFQETRRVSYRDGSEQRGNTGNGPYWVQVDEFGGHPVVDESGPKGIIRTGPGAYRVWDLDELSESQRASVQGRTWIAEWTNYDGPKFIASVGTVSGEWENELFDESSPDASLVTFTRRLRIAVAYAISASLLGVVVLGLRPLLPAVDLAALASLGAFLRQTAPFAITAATHLFALVFLGMVWTSLELIELIVVREESE
jgi:hypothetical protein